MKVPISVSTLTTPPECIYTLNYKQDVPASQSNTTPVDMTGEVTGFSVPIHGRNNFLTQFAGKMRAFGSPQSAITSALKSLNNEHCKPPLDYSEVEKISMSVAQYKPNELLLYNNEEPFEPLSLTSLLKKDLSKRKIIIDGLLRESEVMNVIASPKTGKSWLMMSMALAIARGTYWLSCFQAHEGRVLVIDNELHIDTLKERYHRVLSELNIDPEEVDGKIDIVSLRGALKDIHSISKSLLSIEQGKYSSIIFDAWYRVLPKDIDENDNGAVTQLYNALDKLAEETKSAIILVHHTSKGNQSAKSVTDMGAGAGSQSRAADTHLTLRKHKEENCVVLEAVTRSWEAPLPIVIRLDFPKWTLVKDADPTQIDTGRPQKEREPDKTLLDFIEDCIPTEGEKSESVISVEAKELGYAYKEVERFLKAAVDNEKLFSQKRNKKSYYSLQNYVGLPESDAESSKPKTKREQILFCKSENPNFTAKEIAEKCNLDASYVRKILRKEDGTRDN